MLTLIALYLASTSTSTTLLHSTPYDTHTLTSMAYEHSATITVWARHSIDSYILCMSYSKILDS